MKILSWNVRGLGRPEKRGKIKRLVRERGVDVLFLQETKRRIMEDHFVKSIWPYEEMDYMVVDSVGSAGGLLSIWRPQIFELKSCYSGKNFIILSGTSSPSFQCSLVNIYAPNEVLGRRQLWKSLAGIHHHFPNPWCVGGDFNEIRFIGERKGCLSRDRGMKDFNEFVEKLELTDMPMLGRQYTWCNAMEGNRWNHCPILIQEDGRDWGPKPFKFINAWLSHPSFISEVKKRWEEAQVQGWAGFRVIRKLNLLRSHLRMWNKVMFGNIDTQLQKAEEELHEWDLKAESRSLEEVELMRRREVRSQVWQLGRSKERLWHQKSRQMWAQSGDKNTRYFHIMDSRRQMKNLFDSVVVEGRRVEDPVQIKQEVVRHFSQLFSEDWKLRPKLLGPFAVISPADAGILEAAFSEDEVNPIGLEDYRPISLVSSVYKILAKVLSRRLKRVLPVVINEVQSAFVCGRQILDSVLIANEVVDAWKRSKKKGIILKLDFEKAYDSLNWEFLWSMMNNLGFGEKWLVWMRSCIATARVSVLVNGSPTEEFQPQKGLRQGNPLSPFLFIIAAEALNLLLARAVEKGLFRGASVGGNDLRISHLQFADDTIVFCEGDHEEVLNIKRVLRCFEVMSGLKINYHKSAICGVGFQEDEISGLALRLNCQWKNLPFNFLGLPLGDNPKRKST
ncbi:uncharacterized protein LOC114300334 [Camellia sinensis]|uniref:uncharacterized protein LOC114300334 n=1 Tax=Camellia sinensis TaxID=4442 RepID=UPI001036513A|nr:uncharacterized protein LOC114300334 [Camellia sinensis]